LFITCELLAIGASDTGFVDRSCIGVGFVGVGRPSVWVDGRPLVDWGRLFIVGDMVIELSKGKCVKLYGIRVRECRMN
jgi:hypothetical protein